MADFELMGLTRVTRHKPNKGGDVIVAFFDVSFPCAVEVKGCALVKRRVTPDGDKGFTVWAPRLTDGDDRRGVSFAPEVRQELRQAAVTAYRALGGLVEDDEGSPA